MDAGDLAADRARTPRRCATGASRSCRSGTSASGCPSRRSRRSTAHASAAPPSSRSPATCGSSPRTRSSGSSRRASACCPTSAAARGCRRSSASAARRSSSCARSSSTAPRPSASGLPIASRPLAELDAATGPARRRASHLRTARRWASRRASSTPPRCPRSTRRSSRRSPRRSCAPRARTSARACGRSPSAARREFQRPLTARLRERVGRLRICSAALARAGLHHRRLRRPRLRSGRATRTSRLFASSSVRAITPRRARPSTAPEAAVPDGVFRGRDSTPTPRQRSSS